MNPLIQILSHSENSSFQAKKVDNFWFETDWHCHTEFELILFTAGSGQVHTKIDVQNFEAGDTCLIGSNVPHKFQQTSAQDIHAIVVQFSDDCLGGQFMNLSHTAAMDQNKNNAIDRIFLLSLIHI